MELEFSADLFKHSDEQNQDDESQSDGPRHVYSNQEYGSVQAFVTAEEYEADFEKFKKEFEDEIDKVKKFAEQHVEAIGDDSDAPRLSPAQKERIIQGLETFKFNLFIFDESGTNSQYPNQSMDLVFANGKSTFFSFSKRLHNDKAPLQTRLNALENLGG